VPKRTNLKQRVIAQLRTLLADDGWEVTESKILTDAVTGQDREVDVVVERTLVTDEHVVVSVEVRGQRRKVTVPEVEGLIRKHEHLSTTTLVIASWSGFVLTAHPLIESAGGWVMAVEIEPVEDGEPLTMRTKTYEGRPAQLDVEVAQSDGRVEFSRAVPMDVEVYDAGRQLLCNTEQLVARIVHTPEANAHFLRAVFPGDLDHVQMTLVVVPADPIYVLEAATEEYLPITKLRMAYDIFVKIGTVDFERMRHGRHEFGHALDVVLGTPICFVVTDLDHPNGATLNAAPAPVGTPDPSPSGSAESDSDGQTAAHRRWDRHGRSASPP
jgi:hypothetical protein